MDETAIEFDGASFTDDNLRALPNLDKVEMLTLLDTAVTDDGCRELLRARALVEIAIISDKVSDNTLGVLAQLPALRSFRFIAVRESATKASATCPVASACANFISRKQRSLTRDCRQFTSCRKFGV